MASNAFVASPVAVARPVASVGLADGKTCSSRAVSMRVNKSTSFEVKNKAVSFENDKQFVSRASSNNLSFFKSISGAQVASSVQSEQSQISFDIRADFAWYTVLPGSSLAPGEKTNVFIPFRSGEGAGLDVLIVRDFNGQVFASSNVCPHLGTPLHTGKVSQDGSIICSQHRSAWDLKTGEVKGEWCPYPPVLGKVFAAVAPPAPLLTYQARESGSGIEIYVDLDAKSRLETKTYGSYFRGESDNSGY
mmetsp:Transcript_15587/g.25825  ORF Transcript_15587/g.25825 Transcript_15587/m.25825 type:complete len:248 (-) Transcript_15587:673-1416(-)